MEHPDVKKMTQAEVDKIRADGQMVLKGSNIPKPVRTFMEASFPAYVLEQVEKLGFKDLRHKLHLPSQILNLVKCLAI